MLELNKIYCGDCLDLMKDIDDNSIDAIITDPPYELGFMGKSWDASGIAYNVDLWKQALRVLKPGGYILSFGGSRTYHRMACAIEDAGFEIRDMVEWVYGSGFPKSLNIGKKIDQLQGNEREFVCKNPANRPYNLTKGETSTGWQSPPRPDKDKGTSPYEGWGTALKPAHEPICMARKPLSEKTVAENVLKWGTGGISIDECRVKSEERPNIKADRGRITGNSWHGGLDGSLCGSKSDGKTIQGRFPANLIHDGSEEAIECFPETKSTSNIRHNNGKKDDKTFGKYSAVDSFGFNDSGSAARFFYCAKASKAERNKGLEIEKEILTKHNARPCDWENAKWKGNNHPTVKPIKLMEYLVKLVTTKDAVVLDPFCGSGSTLIACKNLGRNWIGIDNEADYVEIANRRLANTYRQMELIK